VADNVTLNAGAGGATLATDDIAGVHYQIVKLAYGALDAATVVDTTNRFPTSAAQSGTWNITNISGTISLPTGAATAAKQPALGTAGSASADVITVQGVASMTPLQIADNGGNISIDDGGNSITVDGTVGVSGTVTVDSELTTADLDTGAGTDTRAVVGMVLAASGGGLLVGAANPMPISDNGGSVTVDGTVSITSNSSVNVAQVAGTTTDTNSGNKSAGTIRVVIATDQPQLTNKLLVTPDANSAINCAQIAGTSTATGNGTASAGCQRVTIASDNTAFSVNSTTVPATSGGLSVATGSIGATATSVKASAGQVYGWYFYNPNASVAYVQFFNTASGSVTLGTTTPVYSLGIPAGSAANVEMSNGIAHSTAITIAVTTTRAGSTGPGSTVDYNVFYK